MVPDGDGQAEDDPFNRKDSSTSDDRRNGRSGRNNGRRGGSKGRAGDDEPGAGSLGRGGGNRGRSGGQRGGTSGGNDAQPERTGWDFEMYEEISELKKSRVPFKLVRFFDVQTINSRTVPVKYSYRVRLWLLDPNNEPPGGFEKFMGEGRGRKGGDRAGNIGAGGGGSGMIGDDPGGAPGGRKGNEEEEEDTSVIVAVTDAMKHPSVRDRINNDNEELPEGREDLRNTIRSTWSKATGFVTVGAPKEARSEFYAGRIDPPKTTRIQDDKYIEEGEPVANIATTIWNHEFGTRLPANYEAHRSDVLNFSKDSFVLHPVDWSIRKAENVKFDTNAVVLDIIGGQEVRGLGDSRSGIEYQIPGEVLLMKPDGSLMVRNDFEDKQEFFHSLYLEDEIAERGGKKKKKVDDENGRGRRGDDEGGRDPGF